MKTIQITIPAEKKNYPIHIDQNLIEKINDLVSLQKYSKNFVITDSIIEPLFLNKLLTCLPNDTAYLVLPPGEKEKTIASVQKIWTAMHDAGVDRKSLIINLGGGVITDMGGFAAATYMRGLDFINIPTTLLSQVDASVGGKTGFDFAGIKNLIGTFDQPKAVIIDVKTLKTLPKREFISGFGEIIKHGLIADKNYLTKVTSKKPTEFSQEELVDIITRSCEIKKEIVENDTDENGSRKLVNFGHTIGHAVEALSLETEKPLLHGEAISIGMVAATEISKRCGLVTDDEVNLLKNILQNADLPIKISGITKDAILKKMQSDKKIVGGKIYFTLLKKIGEAVFDQVVSDGIIQDAIDLVIA